MDRISGWIWGSGSKEDIKSKHNHDVENQSQINKLSTNNNIVETKISTQQKTALKAEPLPQKTTSTDNTHWYSGLTGWIWGSSSKDVVKMKPSNDAETQPEINKSSNNNVEVTKYSTQQSGVKSEPLKPVLVDTDVSLWRRMGHMTGWIVGSDSKKENKMKSSNDVENQNIKDKSSVNTDLTTETSVQINVKSETVPVKPVPDDSNNTHWYSGLTGWIWGSSSKEIQSVKVKTNTNDTIESSKNVPSEVESESIPVKPVLVDHNDLSYRRQISASLKTYSEDVNKTMEPWLRENTHLQPEDKVFGKLLVTLGATILYVILLNRTINQWRTQKGQRHTILVSKIAALGMYASYLHGEWYVAVTEPPSDKPRTFIKKLVKDFETTFGPSK
ncbi:hypothetical protein ACF0H5_002016 [Mactra antiquata]